uniref:Uncharacterized protein n=1 Tax=Anguilla anguilla TaxID=7936 RepID=A0A0E9SHF5_ANGAN
MPFDMSPVSTVFTDSGLPSDYLLFQAHKYSVLSIFSVLADLLP